MADPLHLRVLKIKAKADRALSDAQSAIGDLTVVDLPENVKKAGHEMFSELEKMRWRLARQRLK